MIQTDSKFQHLRTNYTILWIPILPIDDSIKNNRKTTICVMLTIILFSMLQDIQSLHNAPKKVI